MKKLWKTDVTQAKQLAAEVAGQLKGGEILGLVGPLGSGKTTFTKYLAKQLGIRRNVSSPTFVLMSVYNSKLKSTPKRAVWLYHLDLYRFKNFREVQALGIQEFWGQKNTVTVLEWADKIKKYLPKKTVTIHFQPI